MVIPTVAAAVLELVTTTLLAVPTLTFTVPAPLPPAFQLTFVGDADVGSPWGARDSVPPPVPFTVTATCTTKAFVGTVVDPPLATNA